MTPSLAGLHDREAVAIAPSDTWILDTVALSENPGPTNHVGSLHWITRLNWGYGSTGTLPVPDQYPSFAQRAAAYVAASSGCSRWIIGNESNLRREWPDGQPIFPHHYAKCYKLTRDAIHSLPGHERDEVLIAAPGPWNAELKYSGNPNGDWIKYYTDVIDILHGEIDGASWHAYTHGYNTALVTSEARMDAPFQEYHYEFRAYRDFAEATPPWLHHLPVYLTEANGNGPWQAVGLMPAMLLEIDTWNQSSGRPKVQCVIFYRYPRYDDFYIEGRGDVIAEYQSAVARGYQSPMPTPPMPTPPTPEPTPPDTRRDIDPDLIRRGVKFEFANPPAGTGYWRIVEATWLDEAEADAVGPDHHILGEIKREGMLMGGTPFFVEWPSGATQILSKHHASATYNYDFPMSSSLNEFSIRVNDGNLSDKASGIGMGKNGNPSIHTSTWIDWEWAIAEGSTMPIPPDPEPTPPSSGALAHPLPGAGITQHWGQNADDYARFGIWGHNGTDLGGRPLRTPIRSIAAGIVAYSDFDVAYGHYVRLDHRDLDCYSMYCHLDEPGAAAGRVLAAGDTVGLLGSSGNSSGPHLHLEIRLHNTDGTYREDTPMLKGRVDPETWCVIHGLKL